MRISVVPATEEDRPVLANLIQFYLYEFTSFKEWDVRDDGRFGDYGLDGCWTSDDRHPFLIHANGNLAGFAIVDGRSHLTGEAGIRDLADFFVLRRYQKRGVGEHVARVLFDRFRGRWEVRQVAANLGSQAFWRTVISRYTDGQFREVPWNDARWRGPVQFFDNGQRPGIRARDDTGSASHEPHRQGVLKPKGPRLRLAGAWHRCRACGATIAAVRNGAARRSFRA